MWKEQKYRLIDTEDRLVVDCHRGGWVKSVKGGGDPAKKPVKMFAYLSLSDGYLSINPCQNSLSSTLSTVHFVMYFKNKHSSLLKRENSNPMYNTQHTANTITISWWLEKSEISNFSELIFYTEKRLIENHATSKEKFCLPFFMLRWCSSDANA